MTENCNVVYVIEEQPYQERLVLPSGKPIILQKNLEYRLKEIKGELCDQLKKALDDTIDIKSDKHKPTVDIHSKDPSIYEEFLILPDIRCCPYCNRVIGTQLIHELPMIKEIKHTIKNVLTDAVEIQYQNKTMLVALKDYVPKN